jgi:selenide,water dikinase
MNAATPVLKDLVLVGGGHSHVSVIKSFGMEPMAGVRVTVISRDAHAPYSGMLPGLIAGHYTFDEAHIDLRPLARFAGVRFLHDEVIGVDPVNKTIACRGRPPVPYDVLSINIGSTPGRTVPGAAGAVVPVKPIDGFWRRWETLRDRCLERRDETHIGVVGGGAGGVELLLAVQYRLEQLLQDRGRAATHLHFHLLTATDEILQEHNSRVRSKFVHLLAARGVSVHTGSRVTRVLRADDGAGDGEGLDPQGVADAPMGAASAELPRAYRVELEGGSLLDLDEVLWVTTARAAAWPEESGLDVDDRGFIRVQDTLQAISYADIFAAGDIAAVDDYPRPKAGVFAVRQGPPLTENLRACLLGEPAVPFRPQEKFLSLISTGDRNAIASRGEWAAEGAWVWRWKDRIDRRFMDNFNELPAMEASDGEHDGYVDPRLFDDAAAAELVRSSDADLRHLPDGLSDTEKALDAISSVAMRCGGCGAKVGATALNRVLAALQPVSRPDVVVGLAAADDAAVVDVPAGKQLVQTVDFFRDFIDDPNVFGRVAANHALGDIFAMGAEPQTALATVTIPYGLEAKVQADLLQLLSGAVEVFNDENTALVGGHTGEGAELAVGFAINGLVEAHAALGKNGMRPGDGLILTKPLGTGALFAADMRRCAKGRWVEAALRSMMQSSRAAAACCIEHGTTAMTDVTGFGLLGHLVEMTKASGVDATLDVAAIPALDGALEVMRAGVFSSLQAQNVRLRRAIANLEEAATHPAHALLFDPQTAGGLLASVPGDNVVACVNALRARGYGRAVAIGEVRDSDFGAASVRLLC